MSLRATFLFSFVIAAWALPFSSHALDATQVGACMEKRYAELEAEAQKEGGIGVYWFLYGEQSEVVSKRGRSLLTSSDTTPRPLVALHATCPDMFDAVDCASTRKAKGCIEVFRSHLQRDKDDCVKYVNEWNAKHPNEPKAVNVYCKKELARLGVYIAEERGGIISCTRPAYSCGGDGKGESQANTSGSFETADTKAFSSSSIETHEGSFNASSAQIMSPWDVANSGQNNRNLSTVTDDQGTLTYNRKGVRTSYGDSRAAARAKQANVDTGGDIDLSKLPGGSKYEAPEAKASCRLTRAENTSRAHQINVNGQTVLAHNLPSFEGLGTIHLAGVQYLDAKNGKHVNIYSGYNAFLPHAEAAEKQDDPARRVRLIILCGGYKKISIGGTLGAKIPTGTKTYAAKNEVACSPMMRLGGAADAAHRYAVLTIEAHGTIYISGQSLQLRGVPENDKEMGMSCSSRVVLIGSGTGYTNFLAGL